MRAHMNDRHLTMRSALSIALVYILFGGLWILLSDRAVESMFHDPDIIIRASMLKGWFYVGATGLLLYFLVARLLDRLNASHQREIDNHLEKQRTHDLLAAIADNSGDAIFAKDLQGRYLLFNPAASRFVGKPAAEVLGTDDRAIFPPEQAALMMAIGDRIVATGYIETNEEVLDTVLGTRTFLATKGPLRDAEQRIFGIFGISRDITGMKHAEQTLLENEKRLRLLIQNSPAALAMFDREMCYLAASDRWMTDFGLSDNIIGRSHYEIFPEIGAELKDLHRRGLAGEAIRQDEDRFVRADGSVQWLRWEMRPWQEPNGAIGGIVLYSEDITERKTAEMALRQLADDMQATLQAIPDLLFELDADGCYRSVKATHDALLAAPAEQLLGRKVTDVLPPEAARTVIKALAAASRAGSDYGRTIMLPLAQGTSYFEISVARKPVGAGQAERFIVLSRDITARRIAEEQLRQRNEELERFNRATVGREIDMIGMKKTINVLSRELGRAPPYPLAFMHDEDGKGAP